MSKTIDGLFLAQLLKLICRAFSIKELRYEICLELGIELEYISAETDKPSIVNDMIGYFRRRMELERLIEKCREKRPNYVWPPQLPVPNEENIEQTPPEQSTVYSESASISISEINSSSQASSEHHKQEEKLSEELIEASTSESPSNREKINALMEKANLAEKDENHEAAATSYAELAELFKQEKYFVQARDFARKSAYYSLEVNKREAAIQQYMFAAEVWMNHTAFAETMANSDLEKAKEIASKIGNFTLLARAFLLEAQWGMLRGFRHEIEKMWQKIEPMLPKVHTDFQIEISVEMAIQKAMIARLDGEVETAKTILEEAHSRDWPAKFSHIRLELLRCLLFLYAELARWEDVDRIYEDAQRLVCKQDESESAMWIMHYAASLARRGKAEEALETYLSALDFIKSERATSCQKQHFFQDMIHSLVRHAEYKIFSSTMKYDSERLDLILSALHEDIGYLYSIKARVNYFAEDITSAFTYARYSLIYAWRKGDWSGLNEANRILAFLYHAEQDYTSATLTAIVAGENKLIEKYAPQLSNLQDPEEIKQILDALLQDWPTRVDLQNAILALSKCTDIVPPNQLGRVIKYMVNVLEQYLSNRLASDTCRYAIEVLRSLSPQFEGNQTQQIIQYSINVVSEQKIPWFLQREFVRLLSDCFKYQSKIEANLYRPAMQLVLAYYEKEALLVEANTALLNIAMTAPIKVRNEITTFFREHSNWEYLAVLEESLPEETVKLHLESILRSMTPRQEDRSKSYGFGGTSVRSIINFRGYIKPPFGNFVINELLSAIRNPDVLWLEKNDAILTLRWLSEHLLRERANEISQVLIEVTDGKYTNSKTDDFLKWFSDEEDIRRNSLYALAYISSMANPRLRKRVLNIIKSFSNNDAAMIRMGAAMALRVLEGSYTFPPDFTFILIELLQDQDSQVRHWAASAIGHRVVDGKVPKNASKFLIQRLQKAAVEEVDTHARAGVAYGLRILLQSNTLKEPLKNQVQQAMNELINDVNYRVRRLATG